MPDLVHVTYAHTGKSAQTNTMGMREMQEKAFQARDAQYLLLKAPPASGKSRALMFIALDKLTAVKMYDLIKTTGANGVFFLSGDVHFAEFTKTQPAGWYPIYDFTSSGITHHEDKVASRNNAIRVGNGYQYVNFGFLTIDWKASPVTVKAQVFGNTAGSGSNGYLVSEDAKISHTVTLDELKF